MKASVLSFRDLFERHIRFVVPIFQRGYVWTQDTNWSPLWAEMIDAFRNMTEAHFLGAIVLEQAAVTTGTIEVRRVIDGQQRLMTVQVVLAVIRDVAEEVGLSSLTTRLWTLTVNPGDFPTNAVLKIWPSGADREAFRHATTAGSLADMQSRYPADLPAIVKAYRYFDGRLRALIAACPPDEVAATLVRLVDAISTGMTIIVLDLDEPDDPQSIFETLNALGTPLRAGDLVRNHLFHECDRIELPVDDLYFQHWAPFDNEYWQAKPPEGTDTPSRMDAFLTDYLIMERGRSPVLRRLFPDFRDYLRTCGLSLPDVMARLASYGRIYASLDTDEELTLEEAGIASRLRDVRINVFRPVLLYLFGNYDVAQRLDALKAIESYVLRRQIMGLSTKGYGDRLAGLLGRLAGAAAPGPAVVAELASRDGESGWPTDDEVIDFLRDRPIFTIAPARVRTILLLVEAQMRQAGAEDVVVDTDNLTVEHLMPRALRLDLWPISATDPAARAEEAQARDAVLHSLGNLTMITKTLNQQLANRSWNYKRPRLLLDSFLNLNHNLPKDLTAATIKLRGVKLARYFCEALARPVAPADPAATPVAEPGHLVPPPDDTTSEQPPDHSARGTDAEGAEAADASPS